jgi:SpoVK/Ycf46/Vps4 family AAA+-type ATPase
VKQYHKYIRKDREFQGIPETEIVTKLEAGVYSVRLNPGNQVVFQLTETNSDKLIDLPNAEYSRVVSELELFLEPRTEELFKEYGYLYKRSSLLYGPPGTGKTCIVNRVAAKVVKDGGIVIFNPDPNTLLESFKVINSIEPDRLVMVIFEELDELLTEYESELLNLLDGEIQRRKVIYMATTNYIDRIPARIRRPGRFSSSVEVKFPDRETRRYYLGLKIKDQKKIEEILESTDNFSIDELKEVVLAHMCLLQPIEVITARIREAKGQIEHYDKIKQEQDSEDDMLMLGLSKAIERAERPKRKMR